MKISDLTFQPAHEQKSRPARLAIAALSDNHQQAARFRVVILSLFVIGLAIVVTTNAQAQFSVLYNFNTNGTDGANPANPGILAQGRDGNMYGTTVNGGTNNLGTVFQITPAGKETVIYNCTEAGGYSPYAGLTLGTDGNLYGAMLYGGTYGFGTIFQITTSGSLTVLYSFTGGADGLYPAPPPVLGSDGNWYGTTQGSFSNNGTLYQLTPNGKFKLLYTFAGPQGSDQPRAPLLLATNGSFYGTTEIGGKYNQGTLFSLSPSLKVKFLFNFESTYGAEPLAPLIQGSDGNLYGTTSAGGSNGTGVAFRAPLSGKPKVLYNLPGGSGPNFPYSGVVQATDGNFYGTTYQGGAAGYGDIYNLTPKGKESALFDFDDTDGFRPETTLLQHTNGLLYGDTWEGGTSIPACGNSGCGVFFSWSAGFNPFVSFVSPTGFGEIGATVQILGQGLTGATAVSFDGVAGTFTVSSDTYMTATVPTGAKTGAVTVKTPGGTLTSNVSFRVTPLIKSFNPTSGKVGTVVTITGQSLSQTTKVALGTKSASFTVNSDTQVTATVPTGAKTAAIIITTKGGTATSPGVFTVTQ